MCSVYITGQVKMLNQRLSRKLSKIRVSQFMISCKYHRNNKNRLRQRKLR